MMIRLDAEEQKREDARVARLDDLKNDAMDELRRCTRSPGGPRLNNLEPVNRAMMLGQTKLEKALKRADARLKHPNEWAIREVARMFVQDSAHAQANEWRADAGEALLFALMLQHVIAQYTPTLYTRQQARTLFPVDNSTPAGAETILKRRLIDEDLADDFGNISPQGDDVILVNVSGTSETHTLASFARGIEWSLDELENAAFAGVNIRGDKMAALNRRVDSIFDRVALQGYPDAGFTGAYNNAGIALTVPTTGTWATATAVQILADVHDLMQAVQLATSYNHMPNRLLIPASLTEFLSLREPAAGYGNVRKMIQEDFPGVTILEADRANLYDVAGTGPRIMAYTNDPMMLNIQVPREFTLEAPERHGFRYRLIGRMKLGGAHVHMPLASGYMDGC
jgi:hypothetical protein